MRSSGFRKWIDSLGERDIQSMAQLHEAVKSETNLGAFAVVRDETGLLVRARGQEVSLWLVTEIAKTTFLQTLEREFRTGKLREAIARMS